MTDSCPVEDLAAPDDPLGSWENVPVGESAPFIHRFRTRQQHYVYDVNTRRILRVSPVVWNVLADFGRADREGILTRHSEAHGPKQVVAALDEIDATRKRGLLLSQRPQRLIYEGDESIEDQLANHRKQLILNVTEDCNFRCSYCLYSGDYENHRSHSQTTMGWEVARRAIDEFLAHCGEATGPVISFYGGEPLLSIGLIRRCVAYAREKSPREDLRFSLTTNGSLLTGDTAEFLGQEKFIITVSLDGPAAVHDACRRTRSGKPTFARVRGNVRDFLARFGNYRTDPGLRFNAVASPGMDLRKAEAFFASCDLFTDSMGLNIAIEGKPGKREPLANDDPLRISMAEIRRSMREGHKSGRFGEEHRQPSRWVQGGLYQKRLLMFHKRGLLPEPLSEDLHFLTTCVPGARKLFTACDGSYYACERVVHSPAQRIGDVFGGVQLGRAREVLEQWMDANARQCRHCWCLSHCQVGCPAALENDGRPTREAKAKLCAANRRDTHRALMEYCEILEANPKAFDYMAEIAVG